MKFRFLALPLAAAAIVLSACGGDSDEPNGTSSANGGDGDATTEPGSIAATDEEYLRRFCIGVTEYREALNTEPREGLVRVVEDYLASMEELTPPEDMVEFHAAFLDYLRDAVEEPTALITRDPPVPPDDVRERLAEKTDDIPECEYPTFLDGGSE
jgi:hypothetical protein